MTEPIEGVGEEWAGDTGRSRPWRGLNSLSVGVETGELDADEGRERVSAPGDGEESHRWDLFPKSGGYSRRERSLSTNREHGKLGSAVDAGVKPDLSLLGMYPEAAEAGFQLAWESSSFL